MALQIEPATSADCRAVAEVHVESWRQAYRSILPAAHLASLSVEEREALWRRVVEQRPSQLLVARTEGRAIVGFIAFGASRDADAPPARAA